MKLTLEETLKELNEAVKKLRERTGRPENSMSGFETRMKMQESIRVRRKYRKNR